MTQKTQKKQRINRGVLLNLAVPSNPEFLCVIRSTMTSLAEVMGFAPTDCRSVTRAVDEGLANIIRHAYHSRRDQPIHVVCRRIQARVEDERKAGLEITLVDYGPAVDPTRLSARPLDELKPGGLGLHLIRRSMDAVSYSRVGRANRLRMVRYFSRIDSSK